MKKIYLIICIIITFYASFAQSKGYYDSVFNQINNMLNGKSQLDFKKAVFITENAFYGNELCFSNFCQQIDSIEKHIQQFIMDRHLSDYKLAKQFAIFNYMMEPSVYNNNRKYSYDFEDLTGQKDWTKMFVTKLLQSNTGNCHSLPYLYKILAEDLHAEAYLALAPNHMYIKHKDETGLWVNVELTNGTFPRDSWIISSLAVSTEAIKNETYMEALTLRESVALCLYDLALGYQFKFGVDEFSSKCCDTLLNYYPQCVYAYMIKSDILVEKRKKMMLDSTQTSTLTQLENSISSIYKQIDEMGYKDMPKDQYEQWIRDAENERKKQVKKTKNN